MKSETFIIKGCLASYNEHRKASRTHRLVGAKLKKQNDSIVCLYAKTQLTGKYERIHLDIMYYLKNAKKDPDGVAHAKKYILDGLQQAGVIKNDGMKQIAGWNEKFEVDKDDPRIEIVISEVL